jgi:hypothetical protein
LIAQHTNIDCYLVAVDFDPAPFYWQSTGKRRRHHRQNQFSTACSRRPAGDASKMQFEHAGASHSEAATGACGIAVYTPVGAESAYTDILPTDFSLLPGRGDEFPREDVTIKTDRNQQTLIDLLPNLGGIT